MGCDAIFTRPAARRSFTRKMMTTCETDPFTNDLFPSNFLTNFCSLAFVPRLSGSPDTIFDRRLYIFKFCAKIF